MVISDVHDFWPPPCITLRYIPFRHLSATIFPQHNCPISMKPKTRLEFLNWTTCPEYRLNNCLEEDFDQFAQSSIHPPAHFDTGPATSRYTLTITHHQLLSRYQIQSSNSNSQITMGNSTSTTTRPLPSSSLPTPSDQVIPSPHINSTITDSNGGSYLDELSRGFDEYCRMKFLQEMALLNIEKSTTATTIMATTPAESTTSPLNSTIVTLDQTPSDSTNNVEEEMVEKTPTPVENEPLLLQQEDQISLTPQIFPTISSSSKSSPIPPSSQFSWIWTTFLAMMFILFCFGLAVATTCPEDVQTGFKTVNRILSNVRQSLPKPIREVLCRLGYNIRTKLIVRNVINEAV